eukprot:gene22476-23654_t
MEQFKVEPVLGHHLTLFGYDVSFTNSALFMVVVFVLLAVFISGGLKRQLVPGRWQVAAEDAVSFIDNMVSVNIGAGGKKFAPYIFSLFYFILFANLIGVVPLAILPGFHTFAVTSHITVTAILAFLSFAIVLVVGFAKHGFKFFNLFVPHGVPIYLIPLVTAIEIISFLSRPISLSVRLFANMLAGHITLKVFAGFIVSMSALGGLGILGSFLPLAMAVALTALEFLVAFLQAYVFTVLTCMYLNDAIHPGH